MLLIFDCDGVLVDSETLSCRIDAEILTECGVPYTAEEVARDFTGVSVKDQITRIPTISRNGSTAPCSSASRRT
jgi:beta-phosphoglucomutase-like phosphatase (HAD superfamily)